MDKTSPNDPWVGCPEELKHVLIALYHGDGTHSHKEAIAYLHEWIADAEMIGEADKLNRLEWVHEFFFSCFDAEVYADEWIDNAIAALDLIRASEALLLRGKPDVAKPLARDFIPDPENLGVICLMQDLNAFGCVAAGLSGDTGEFTRRLNAAVKANELDVRMLADMNSDNDSDISSSGRAHEGLYPPSRLWTGILEFISRAPLQKEEEAEVIEAYKRYTSYLIGALQWGAPVMSSLIGAKMALKALEEGDDIEPDGDWPPF